MRASVATATPDDALRARKLTPFPSRMARKFVDVTIDVLICENIVSTTRQRQSVGLHAVLADPSVNRLKVELGQSPHLHVRNSPLAHHRIDGVDG